MEVIWENYKIWLEILDDVKYSFLFEDYDKVGGVVWVIYIGEFDVNMWVILCLVLDIYIDGECIVVVVYIYDKFCILGLLFLDCCSLCMVRIVVFNLW